MNKGDINKISGEIESNTVALEKIAHYLKTIAFNLTKIDQDLSGKHPYKLHMDRGKRR